MAPGPMVQRAFDPHYQNIEETIDALERRINQENVRYSKLIANRHIYEQWMGPEATSGLIHEAAIRMVNFDPNFDAEPLPLPRPWLYHSRPLHMAHSGHYHYHSCCHHNTTAQPVFAYPELPPTARRAGANQSYYFS